MKEMLSILVFFTKYWVPVIPFWYSEKSEYRFIEIMLKIQNTGRSEEKKFEKVKVDMNFIIIDFQIQKEHQVSDALWANNI